MTHKHGLRTPGFALIAALIFSAIAANGVRADQWFVKGAAFHGTETFSDTGGAVKLLSALVNIECTSLTFSGSIAELTKGLITVTLTGCNLLENKPPPTLSSVCSINAAAGKPGSGVITFNASFTAFLHGGESYVLFEPDVTLKEPKELNERSFTTINIVDSVEPKEGKEEFEECVVGSSKLLRGTQVALIAQFNTELLSHEIQAVSDLVQKALFPGDFLHFGANRITLDTTPVLTLHLAGDQQWSYR